jgi:hypothetical protein
MKLFTTCQSCTIELWGWQRTCSACGTACSPSPASPPETRGRQGAGLDAGAQLSRADARSQVAQVPGDPSHRSHVRRTERNQRCPRIIGLRVSSVFQR